LNPRHTIANRLTDNARSRRLRTYVEPKSRAGRRTVPIAGVLRDLLVEHKLRARGELVVPGRDGGPLVSNSLVQRSQRAWRRAALHPITLHEARHTFASLMIAAGANARALSSYMGHSSVTITYDRYGHLMPGNESEAAALLDAYLERANTRARLAPCATTRSTRSERSARGAVPDAPTAANGVSSMRQLCASAHPNQWTSMDFCGLRGGQDPVKQPGPCRNFSGGGGI